MPMAEALQPWPVELPAWSVYHSELSGGNETTQPWHMAAVSSQEPEAEPLIWQEAMVPAQVRMGTAMPWPESTMEAQRNATATACVGTLRHRRGQESYTQDQPVKALDLPNPEKREAETDTQARELANGLLVQMQAGGEMSLVAVASFERLAFADTSSSRAAQIALEEASVNNAVALATGLRGHVLSAVQSKHANHVVQKITEVMPASRASFIVDELQGFAYDVARHMFGCRVLCRILEHLSPNDLSTMELVEELFIGVEELCSHSYGSFVVRHLLEFGLPDHKERVVKAIRTDLLGHAKHKFGSHVVEAALQHASLEDRRVLASELLRDREQLMSLASNQFGRHIVRSLLALPDGLKQEALDILLPMQRQLKASRYGKSVLQAVRASA